MTKCAECKYSKRDWTNPYNPDHYCANKDSESYGYNTGDLEKCEKGKEKPNEID